MDRVIGERRRETILEGQRFSKHPTQASRFLVASRRCSDGDAIASLRLPRVMVSILFGECAVQSTGSDKHGNCISRVLLKGTSTTWRCLLID